MTEDCTPQRRPTEPHLWHNFTQEFGPRRSTRLPRPECDCLAHFPVRQPISPSQSVFGSGRPSAGARDSARLRNSRVEIPRRTNSEALESTKRAVSTDAVLTSRRTDRPRSLHEMPQFSDLWRHVLSITDAKIEDGTLRGEQQRATPHSGNSSARNCYNLLVGRSRSFTAPNQRRRPYTRAS